MQTITETTPIGKMAVLLAMSDTEEEEKALKQYINQLPTHRAAVTFITGISDKISHVYIKSIVNTALSTETVNKTSGQLHALIHAGLEALNAMVVQPTVDSSLKMKVSMVTNKNWVAVATYGYSAFSLYTNHERMGLGIMHLK
ncbi:hypothetical protein A9G11_04145 [Gilliamella sp. wkB108]|uniref:HutP family protein n=1 Tax=Gilliamella sp. wkB108 TaxID=3120256 RepID=UPI00080DEA41|nr:HutP family protein [Gilliamella apicola]OCG24274.1 hypothetical protein A9G11_04145 [Gilliamella apicola]